jgi:hypothetical protein
VSTDDPTGPDGVVSAEEFRRLSGTRSDLKAFLLAGPDLSVLELERARSLPRHVEP